MKTLNETEINEALSVLNGWQLVDNVLEKNVAFTHFKEAFAFMTRVAFEAELMQHHPDWSNTYNKLTIRLSTHDANGITEKDIKFAKTIEKILKE